MRRVDRLGEGLGYRRRLEHTIAATGVPLDENAGRLELLNGACAGAPGSVEQCSGPFRVQRRIRRQVIEQPGPRGRS
jgi:hypothetical protein